MSQQVEFAVVDCETTGFGKSDRIVEIAVVRVGANRDLLQDYVTLVNPCRDIGPSYVHGITASDVRDAPLFEQIAGDFIATLAGCVVVAHNVLFDLRMIRSELNRIAYTPPQFPYLCTMKLARRLDPHLESRSLDCVCRHFGIRLDRPHGADCDAHAAAEILLLALERSEGRGGCAPIDIEITGKPVGSEAWVRLPRTGRTLQRGRAREIACSKPSMLGRLVSELPLAACANPDHNQYLEVLDRILEDRRVTQEEITALSQLAKECGIDSRLARDLHERYLRDLVRLAMADGQLTEFERNDLDDVQRLLGLDDECVSEVLKETSTRDGAENHERATTASREIDLRDKTVCFTGQFTLPTTGSMVSRETVERFAEKKGLVVVQHVSKKLDVLVVADPDTMSSKARKAREYGVRIIAEPVFWKVIGQY